MSHTDQSTTNLAAEVFWQDHGAAFRRLADGEESYYARRAQLTAEFIRDRVGTGRILDVGCGSGLVSAALFRCGFDVYGTDVSRTMLNAAAARLQALGGDVEGRFRLTQGTTPPFPWKFDVIAALGVFPYVPNYEAFARQLAAQLRPGGVLVASCANRRSLFTYGAAFWILVCQSRSRSSRVILGNLLRTGVWSGGYVETDSAQQAYSAAEMDAMMIRAGFGYEAAFDLYHVRAFALDHRPLTRSAIGKWFARRWGWNHIGFYRTRANT